MNAPGVWYARKLIARIMATAGPPPRGTAVTQIRSGKVRAASRLPHAYTRGLPADTQRLRLRVPPGMALPPMPIQAGGAEMLCADARHLDKMVRDAGGDCELEIWPGQVHVFQALPLLVPEADKTLDRAAEFLYTALISHTVTEKVS